MANTFAPLSGVTQPLQGFSAVSAPAIPAPGTNGAGLTDFVSPIKPLPGPLFVPNILGLTESQAILALNAVGLVLGSVTSAYSASYLTGTVSSQTPVAGTVASAGSAVNLVLSLGLQPVVVPNLIGLSQAAAALALNAVGLDLGFVSQNTNASVPTGQIYTQSLAAGTLVAPGTLVNVSVSLGAGLVAVPQVAGETASAATAAITAAGLVVGTTTLTLSSTVTPGLAAGTNPIAGTLLALGSAVTLEIATLIPQFDVDVTVISQYANSPILLALIENFSQYFDPTANLSNFYNLLWNISTARGFGLDIWGRILGVSRIIPIPGTSGDFGFENADVPPDWQTFGNTALSGAGGPFYTGTAASNSYKLADGPYLTLLLTKAFANICATTPPALNALITNLFPGRGACYTVDLGAMQMSYVFQFALSQIEFAILAYSGVLAHPAGVAVNIVVVPTATFFGFNEQGPAVEPFDYGVFFI